ncbi:MAG: ogr/Delta-like zinc finger family protein [Candidatus Oceanisphaera merdipullorum]|nr:ogr/Delta-like zinc finger family protein [Candidatus Oceanisphaera merdipullorum]
MKKSPKRFNPPRASERRACLHCGWFSRIRTSEAQSKLSRITKLQCSNVDCGFTWAEVSEALYTISPSACPNPHVHLPIRRKDLA